MPDINILVVDDESEIADLVEIYLVSDGYKVFKVFHIFLCYKKDRRKLPRSSVVLIT